MTKNLQNNKKKSSPKNPAGLKVRLLASQRLQEVLDGKNFTPYNMSEINDGRDRALANRLITVALRYHGHINIIFEKTLQKGMPKKSDSFEAIMRIALSELLFIKEMADHSSIFLAVEAIKQNKKTTHLSKLANGILRRVQREKADFSNLALADLFPDWLKNRWLKTYGKQAVDEFGKALLKGAPLDLTLKEIDDDLIKNLGAKKLIFDSVRIVKRDCPVVELAGFENGEWWAQDVASALPARLMNLPAKSKVLDMCAAPGGKSAQLIKQGYEVSALEIDEKRLDRLKENLARLNYQAKTILADALIYQPKEKFDGIFVDAPCSSTGTFRRHPEVIWQNRKQQSEGRVALQKLLVEHAISLLKPKGVLIYATCSLEQNESEQVAKWVLEKFSNMISSPIKASELDGKDILINENGYLRSTPDMNPFLDNEEGMDGFFAARFIHQ